jgi:hypothetical protein
MTTNRGSFARHLFGLVATRLGWDITGSMMLPDGSGFKVGYTYLCNVNYPSEGWEIVRITNGRGGETRITGPSLLTADEMVEWLKGALYALERPDDGKL